MSAKVTRDGKSYCGKHDPKPPAVCQIYYVLVVDGQAELRTEDVVKRSAKQVGLRGIAPTYLKRLRPTDVDRSLPLTRSALRFAWTPGEAITAWHAATEQEIRNRRIEIVNLENLMKQMPAPLKETP